MKLKLIILLLITSLIFPNSLVTASSDGFKDVPKSHWANEAINYLVEKGILKGYPGNVFKPNQSISREEYATILVKALNLPIKQPSSPSFIDVSSKDWSYKYVESAKYYLTGYKNSSGQFLYKPLEKALREDIAVSIVKALNLQDEDIDLSILDKYPDKNQISQNLRKYIAIATKHGFMKGSNRGFEPQKPLTRAEASMLLYRIIANDDEKVVFDDDDEKVTFNEDDETTNDDTTKIKMPNVIGMTLENAKIILDSLSIKYNIEEKTNTSIGAGEILKQNPTASSSVDKNSTALLTVSAGTGLFELPDVEGKELKEALSILNAYGLDIEIKEQYNDTIFKNKIITQVPEAYKEVSYNSKVTLFVSLGEEFFNPNEMGTTSGNAKNGGYFVKKDNWIYYSQYNEQNKKYELYKERPNGTGRKSIYVSDKMICQLNAIGNWVYFKKGRKLDYSKGLYRIREDGTGYQELTNNRVRNVIVVGEWIYYINETDNSTLYRIRVNGTEREKLNEKSVNNFAYWDGYIYYSTYSKDSNYVYKIKWDGTENESLEFRAEEILVNGSWIYYYTYENHRGSICRRKIDGTSYEKLIDGRAYDICISGEWLYYYSTYYHSPQFHRIKIDGSMNENNIMDIDRHYDYSVFDNKVYYTNYENTEIGEKQF